MILGEKIRPLNHNAANSRPSQSKPKPFLTKSASKKETPTPFIPWAVTNLLFRKPNPAKHHALITYLFLMHPRKKDLATIDLLNPLNKHLTRLRYKITSSIKLTPSRSMQYIDIRN